jgi:ankyrin repeat protein
VKCPGGGSLIHAACESGNLDLVKKLVVNGADVHRVDDKGRSPIFSTLVADPDSVVGLLRYLIDECGLDINAGALEGKPTLLLEVMTDRKRMRRDLAEFLVGHGVNMASKALNGMTAYDLAMQMCTPDVKEVFARHKPAMPVGRGRKKM